jgi:hypothetical protein
MVANCVSFGYDPNTPSCELYSAPVRNQKWTSDAAATKTYANRNCYSCTDASTYTVHVPEPTPYVPDVIFSQSFGFDPGYVNSNGYLFDYGNVFTFSGAANQGVNYLNLVLNPPQDGTWAQATYGIPANVYPNQAYTFFAAFRPGRDARASNTATPDCQGQIQVFDLYGNVIGDSGDYQDLPDGWTRLSAAFNVGGDETVQLAMNVQCANDDLPTVGLDSLYVRSGARAIREEKVEVYKRKIDPHRLPHKDAVGKIDPHKLP